MKVSRTRFLADLTLGFADGLTVPFALTAGLSSLGKTETIISAGIAEICAGCISMGIGGYLSAKGEAEEEAEQHKEKTGYRPVSVEEDDSVPERTTTRSVDRDGDSDNDSADMEKGHLDETVDANLDLVEAYLEPLNLPLWLQPHVILHATTKPDVLAAIAKRGQTEAEPISPILTGLSVALGYMLGGFIPLSPYFFVADVGKGLLWSSVACVLALFIFGFGKRASSKRRDGWLLRAGWDGLQMAGLGGLAAGAAVLCVTLLNDRL